MTHPDPQPMSIVHSYLKRAANPLSEEPDALVADVLIRGGPGWATIQVYPTGSSKP